MAAAGAGPAGGEGLTITFVTGNKKKLEEVVAILKEGGGNDGFTVTSQSIDLPELQGEPEEIAAEKCKLAFERIQRPVRGTHRLRALRRGACAGAQTFLIVRARPRATGDGGGHQPVLQRARRAPRALLQGAF